MFGIGPMEIVVILVVALLFVGPQKLPELAKQFGKFFVHAKRMTTDVRSTIDGYVKEAESEIIADERRKIKQLIEAEIAENPLPNSELDEKRDDHLQHEQDEYFEKADDDPAYRQAQYSNVEESNTDVWSPHTEEEQEKKS